MVRETERRCDERLLRTCWILERDDWMAMEDIIADLAAGLAAPSA
jgi:hypothetical protein